MKKILISSVIAVPILTVAIITGVNAVKSEVSKVSDAVQVANTPDIIKPIPVEKKESPTTEVKNVEVAEPVSNITAQPADNSVPVEFNLFSSTYKYLEETNRPFPEEIRNAVMLVNSKGITTVNESNYKIFVDAAWDYLVRTSTEHPGARQYLFPAYVLIEVEKATGIPL